MKYLSDKYFLICLIAGVLILSYAFTGSSENTQVDWDQGMVYDVSPSNTGFTFQMMNCDGISYKCYSKTEPVDGCPYEIQGSWSDDNTIFFVSEMNILS